MKVFDDIASCVRELKAERDFYKAAYEQKEKSMNQDEYLSRLHYLQDMGPYSLLQELLATILDDGGTYCSEHGTVRAVMAAEDRLRALQSRDDPTPNSV